MHIVVKSSNSGVWLPAQLHLHAMCMCVIIIRSKKCPDINASGSIIIDDVMNTIRVAYICGWTQGDCIGGDVSYKDVMKASDFGPYHMHGQSELYEENSKLNPVNFKWHAHFA